MLQSDGRFDTKWAFFCLSRVLHTYRHIRADSGTFSFQGRTPFSPCRSFKLAFPWRRPTGGRRKSRRPCGRLVPGRRPWALPPQGPGQTSGSSAGGTLMRGSGRWAKASKTQKATHGFLDFNTLCPFHLFFSSSQTLGRNLRSRTPSSLLPTGGS